MPSTSKKQHNFMAAVANNPSFAKKAGVPQSVGKDFSNADKGKTFKEGGSMAGKMNPGFMAMMAKKKESKPSAMGKPTMKPGMSTAKDGMKKPTPMAKTDMAGSMMGMKKGGMPMVMKDGKKVPAFAAKKMATGGLAAGHKSANGIATKGKTKGKQISMPGNKGMKSGGMAKKYC
jgi:hypothetical protein